MDGVGVQRLDPRHQQLERIARLRQQLMRRTCVAEIVGAFAEESEAAAANVETRAHAVAVLRRCLHGDNGRQRQTADAREGVRNHLSFNLELSRIGDVRVRAAAARRVRKRRAPVC
jgi:hypothetical protein